jgi:hypothetical protein
LLHSQLRTVGDPVDATFAKLFVRSLEDKSLGVLVRKWQHRKINLEKLLQIANSRAAAESQTPAPEHPRLLSASGHGNSGAAADSADRARVQTEQDCRNKFPYDAEEVARILRPVKACMENENPKSGEQLAHSSLQQRTTPLLGGFGGGAADSAPPPNSGAAADSTATPENPAVLRTPTPRRQPRGAADGSAAGGLRASTASVGGDGGDGGAAGDGGDGVQAAGGLRASTASDGGDGGAAGDGGDFQLTPAQPRQTRRRRREFQATPAQPLPTRRRRRRQRRRRPAREHRKRRRRRQATASDGGDSRLRRESQATPAQPRRCRRRRWRSCAATPPRHAVHHGQFDRERTGRRG